MLQAAAGYDAKDPSSASVGKVDYAAALDGDIKSVRVGVPRELNEGASDEVTALVQRAITVLQELGSEVEEVSLPLTGEYASPSGNIITWSEAAQVHAPWYDQLSDYTPGVQQKILIGQVISGAEYNKAQQMRRLVQDEITGAFQNVDVLVSPVMQNPPGPIQSSGSPEGSAGAGAIKMASQRSFTRPFNITGQPAVSVPCGFSPEGLPVGLQIAGRLFDDATVLKVAHAYERATDWHNMHPSL